MIANKVEWHESAALLPPALHSVLSWEAPLPTGAGGTHGVLQASA